MGFHSSYAQFESNYMAAWGSYVCALKAEIRAPQKTAQIGVQVVSTFAMSM